MVFDFNLIIFYIFAFTVIFSSIMVISSKNAVHSVLFLVLVFCNIVGLLILLKVEFIGMVFLIVYVGAIAVLFLFVVMMLNLKVVQLDETFLRYLPIGVVLAIVFFIELFLMMDQSTILFFDYNYLNYITIWLDLLDYMTNIEILALLLYTYYYYLFLLAGLILLVAMLGSISLTLYNRTGICYQSIHKQVSQDFLKTIRLLK